MKIKLETKNNPTLKRLLDYLEANASDELVEKINNGTPYAKDGVQLINKKTLDGFMRYATEEAKKLAEKGAMGTSKTRSTVLQIFERSKSQPASVVVVTPPGIGS